MNELQPDPKTVVLWLFGLLGWLGSAVMSILTWNVRREVKKFEALEQRSHQFVTRPELNRTLRDMQEARERMHAQNREDLQYIRERVDSILERK